MALLFQRFVGAASFKITRPEPDDDGSSLEQDLRDVLGILPLAELRRVVEKYARSDKQVADSLGFVNDQARFIEPELKKIPHARLFLFVLKELGLELDHWVEDFGRFWKGLPTFEEKGSKDQGGLTGMISRMVRLVPRDEMHELLCRKVRQSKSFRTLLIFLASQQFVNLANELRTNVVMQRNYYWARESGLEVIFAVELLGELYLYLNNLTREMC